MEELQLINTALLKNNIIPDMLAYGRDIFKDYKYKIAYDIINQLYNLNITVDLPVFVSEAKKQDLYNKIGGDEFISEISQASTVNSHSTILNNLEHERKKRSLKEHAIDFVNKKIDIDEFVLKSQMIFENEIDLDDGMSLSEYLKNNPLDEIFNKNAIIESRISSIDDKIGGFLKCDLNIIASRPGEGKTTLGLQIANSIEDIVLFFSLEMPKNQILAKEINKITRIPALKILKGNLNDYDKAKVFKAINQIQVENSYIIYDKRDSFHEMISKIRKGIRKHNSKTVIIDYLQLISGVKAETRNLAISEITGQLKVLAMNEEITIILLSQLNREVEKQKREPVLSDLRDSGAIEQDASLVMFIHEGEIIIAKIRLGQAGRITGFYFDKPNSKFVEGIQGMHNTFK